MYDFLVDHTFNLENTQSYILSIQVNLGGFSFSVISPQENCLLAWKSSPLIITNQEFLPRRFQEWIEKEEIFRHNFNEVRLVFDTKEFITVPEKYFDETERSKLLKSVFDFESEFETETNKIETHNMRLLFALPKQIKENLSSRFPNLKLLHPLKSCVENLPPANYGEHGMILLFSSKCFYVLLYKGQKLLLVNSFTLSHKNDIIFYIFSIAKQFQFAREETKLFMAGDIYDEEETIGEIKKYFVSTQILKPAKNIQIDSEIFTEPEYRLFNLLNSI